MRHSRVFNGADGYACSRCGKTWDLNEPEPEVCETDATKAMRVIPHFDNAGQHINDVVVPEFELTPPRSYDLAVEGVETQFDAAVADVLSHADDWRKALRIVKAQSHDIADKSYWEHQQVVLERIIEAFKNR